MRKTLLAALAASTALAVVTPALAQATDPNQALAPDTRQATLQHRAGFEFEQPLAVTRDPNQTSIPDFNVINTAFRWNIETQASC